MKRGENMNGQLPIHETLELHELLTFKTTCAAKSNSMLNMVTDSELKKILQEDIKVGGQAISELKNLLQNKVTKTNMTV